ncbi:hypothetical protein BX616_002145 [Lobosporangium transversale]|nr:hypothetical protein BX616_002145 [Lobosporangium transversale]
MADTPIIRVQTTPTTPHTITNAAESTDAGVAPTHETSLLDHDYDELVDEDWLDMNNPDASHRSFNQNKENSVHTHIHVTTAASDTTHSPDLSKVHNSDNNNGSDESINNQEVSLLLSANDSYISQAHVLTSISSAPSPSTMSLLSDFEVDTVPAAPTSIAEDNHIVSGRSTTLTTASSTTTSIPSSLMVSTAESSTPQEQIGNSIPSPSSSSSTDSEYSLLHHDASAEQSRKNSLSGVTGFGFQTFPSCSPSISASQLSQDQNGQNQSQSQNQNQDQDEVHEQKNDDEIAVTSPSLSDFVQVGSDHGEDFSALSGNDFGSTRSSNNETPNSASSEAVAMPVNDYEKGEEDKASLQLEPVLSALSAVNTNVGHTSGSTDTIVPAGTDAMAEIDKRLSQSAQQPQPQPQAQELLGSTAANKATDSSLPEPQTYVSPSITVKRAMYRTTVEDAESSSGGEQTSDDQRPGLRNRRRGNERRDYDNVHGSFPTTTGPRMPGAFNVGLDAEIPQYSAAQSTSPSAATAANNPPMEERQCRICLGGADEEDTLGRLISPCLCKGSMKYVHVEWRTSFARYLAHPLTVFILTIIVFATAVFAAGFAMKLLLYLMMDEPHEFIYPVDIDDYDDDELIHLKESVVIFRTPDSLRAVFRIDKTHMVFGSFFVSIIGFLQLLLSTLWMGGGGGVFRIGGFGLGGGRRRGGRGADRQREAGIGGVLMLMILVFGLFKSVYMTYQFVHRVSRRVLAKAEMMVLEVQ